MDNKARVLYCGNLSGNVTEDMLYELFQQAGPLEFVQIAKDKEGNKRNFGFVTFKHDISVPYAVALMKGVSLFGKPLRLELRTGAESDGNPYLEQLGNYQMAASYFGGGNPHFSPEMRGNANNSNLVQYPTLQYSNSQDRYRQQPISGDRFQNDSRFSQIQSLSNSASPQHFRHSPNSYGFGNSTPYEGSERSSYSPQPRQLQNQHCPGSYGRNNSGYSENRAHQKSNSAPRTQKRY